MDRKLITILLAGSILAILAFPLAVQARGGPDGQGKGWRFQNQNRFQDRQRLRDESCQNRTPSRTESQNKKANTNGPRDDTGNNGQGPRDGTGMGTSSQK